MTTGAGKLRRGIHVGKGPKRGVRVSLRLRQFLAAMIALLILGGGLACHNDRKMIDRHEQTLMDEED